jgi:sensor domain CHASE-containing protein
VVVIFDSNGRLLFGKGIDVKAQQDTEIPAGVMQHFSPRSPLLKHLDTHSKLAGILPLPNGPMLMAAQPILTSKAEGPVRGTLVMGRWLGSAEVQQLRSLAHLSIPSVRL